MILVAVFPDKESVHVVDVEEGSVGEDLLDSCDARDDAFG